MSGRQFCYPIPKIVFRIAVTAVSSPVERATSLLLCRVASFSSGEGAGSCSSSDGLPNKWGMPNSTNIPPKASRIKATLFTTRSLLRSAKARKARSTKQQSAVTRRGQGTPTRPPVLEGLVLPDFAEFKPGSAEGYSDEQSAEDVKQPLPPSAKADIRWLYPHDRAPQPESPCYR